MLVDRIKEITNIPAISGHEDKMRQYMAEQMHPFVDEIQYDHLGGVFGIIYSKKANAKTVMVAAHMDEVGFMVSQIEDNGIMTAIPIGGWNPAAVSAHRFTLMTQNGMEIPVVSSSISPHLLKNGQSPDSDTWRFDAGFTSKEEAEQYGVHTGDAIVPYSEAIETVNGQNMIAKAWDNRYGCLVILEALKQIDREKLSINLVIGCNVQEEVGLRGAPVSAHQFKPDIFLAVDCSAANDIVSKHGTFGHIGEGCLMRVQDPRYLMSPRMKQYLLYLAESHHINYQYYISKGGTDAAAVQSSLDGIPSAVIGVCARYIHTHHTLFNLDDFESAKQLLIHVLQDIDSSKIDYLTYQVEDENENHS